MQAIEVHNADDLPVIYARLLHGESELPIDLSAASTTVTAKFRAVGSATVLDTITCAKVFGGTDGWVSMTWAATSLDVAAGRYEIEISVSFNGAVQTANRYYWQLGMKLDDARTLPVRIRDDF